METSRKTENKIKSSADFSSNTYQQKTPFLKTDNALCYITEHVMPKSRPQF